jgi:hypothetical protein
MIDSYESLEYCNSDIDDFAEQLSNDDIHPEGVLFNSGYPVALASTLRQTQCNASSAQVASPKMFSA